MTTLPIQLIKQYFQYLMDEYGFCVDREQYSPDTMGNAEVVVKLDSTTVQVVIDRSQVLIKVGATEWSERKWLDFAAVARYFDPSLKEAYVFPEVAEMRVEIQLDRLAHMLRQDCEPVLRGDFSMAKQIRERRRGSNY
ncbi:MAG: hypothetical protein AB1894_05535 [Chloroflexota bacterium]